MALFKLIRPVNLFMIIVVQIIIKWGILIPLNTTQALTTVDFILLIVATVCIAAGGNIINDLHDVSIDTINKPDKVIIGTQVSEKTGYSAYIALTFIGVCVGFYVANVSGFSGMAVIFVAIAALLYVYATHLKAIVIIGNIVVSLLVAMSLLIVVIFDILPVISEQELSVQKRVIELIGIYAAFAFYINLLREIVKDIQDVNGDKNGGRITIPIAFGRKRTTTIVFVLASIAVIAILMITYLYLYVYTTLAFFIIFLVAAPLLVFCIRIWNAETAKHFKLLSLLLKIVMFMGILSLLFFTEILHSL